LFLARFALYVTFVLFVVNNLDIFFVSIVVNKLLETMHK